MFVVKWSLAATNEFAVISVLHPNRWKDINDADNDIDKKLRTNPTRYGQYVAEGLWRIISSPLAVYFSVDGNEVNVSSVAWVE